MRKPFSLLKSEPFELAVTNEHSQSLPDARIRIKRDGLVVVDTTADDTEGLQVLAAGRTYQIEARHTHIENGKSIQLPPKAFRYTMPESGPGKLAIELRPGGRISGTILDPNGSPVFGASILVRTKDSKDAAPPRLLKTNRAGVFRSQPFAAGRWILTINHPQIGTMTTETVVEINKNQSVGTLRFSRK
jgi:hypothetical protein